MGNQHNKGAAVRLRAYRLARETHALTEGQDA